MMPRVDGFTICKAIKNHPLLRRIKVIMLTSKDGIFDRARGADAGADGYIVKPFQRDTMLAVVEQHVPADHIRT
jgi:twitching motility two-component system response regulator PilG